MTETDCHDCGAKPGQPHTGGCDVERCPDCGAQAIGCGCSAPKRSIWTGEWPGERECRELGWYVIIDPVTHRIGSRCGPDHPHAHPDLNRLAVETKWDAKTQKRVLRDT